MNIKIDFSDLRKLEKTLQEEAMKSPSSLKKGLAKAVITIRNEAVNVTKSGVVYSDGIYETGNLRRGLTWKLLNKYSGLVHTSRIDYGKFVEFGTRKMKAKPFLKLGFERKEKKVKKIFEDILARISKVIIE